MNRSYAIAALALASLVGAPAISSADPGVTPPTVAESLDPGDSITIDKTVETPIVPPKPDIVLLVDHTGSMGGAIDNVKANMEDIIEAVALAQPDAQFAVAIYCDIDEPVPAYQVLQDLTADPDLAVDAVQSIELCFGDDEPEAQLPALYALGDAGGAGEISYRADSSRVVAWFGDAPGHDPRLGITEAQATQSLLDAGVKTLAISVGADNLDSTGQATRITTATGGSFFSGVGADEVADAILAGLTSLPVEVAGVATCDPGLTVSLDPTSQIVTSGEDAEFEETITVAADAPQGTTLTCDVEFTIDGEDAGDGFTQSVSIGVNDVTPPTVTCEQGPNPAGFILPEESEAGFFTMTASDNVDGPVGITVNDTGSSASFGVYPSGTTFKLTQAPGAEPKVSAFTGEVEWHFRLKGDAELTATDSSGNTGSVFCLVPPHS